MKHGVAVLEGLDQGALLLLRSRGLSDAQSVEILKKAFVTELDALGN